MKKAEILQDLAVYMRDRVDNGFDITITDAEARALVEALESLRWVNMYRNDEHQLTIGNEYLNYTDANNRRVPDAIFIETVGIIRLKDDEQ